MADLQRGVFVELCFALIEDRLQVVSFKLMRRTANGLPQACGNAATLSGSELQGGIHDGFIGGDHGGIMGAKNGWGKPEWRMEYNGNTEGQKGQKGQKRLKGRRIFGGC